MNTQRQGPNRTEGGTAVAAEHGPLTTMWRWLDYRAFFRQRKAILDRPDIATQAPELFPHAAEKPLAFALRAIGFIAIITGLLAAPIVLLVEPVDTTTARAFREMAEKDKLQLPGADKEGRQRLQEDIDRLTRYADTDGARGRKVGREMTKSTLITLALLPIGVLFGMRMFVSLVRRGSRGDSQSEPTTESASSLYLTYVTSAFFWPSLALTLGWEFGKYAESYFPNPWGFYAIVGLWAGALWSVWVLIKAAPTMASLFRQPNSRVLWTFVFTNFAVNLLVGMLSMLANFNS